MPSIPQDRSIRRLSRFLALATLAGMVLVPLFGLGVWFLPGLANALGELPGSRWVGNGQNDWFVFQIRLGAAGISMIGIGLTLYGLFGVRRLFLEGAEGQYFSEASVGGFRQFALASLVGAIWAPFETTVFSVYLSVANPHTRNAVEISLGSDTIESIGTALLLFLMAHILAEGRRRHEELELIL
ncbi:MULTISPECIES: DUF2975 domain-containing protein [Maricaulis]|uniref:DUF2975 family protein n=1 Tax=Maricaulis maris TaxID=74318 RepID=A0A495DFP7_9PROT|nr:MULTISPECIES: DUF2975 domain-containing protein [Maricaulis]RKR00356.1 hypothetical protein C7435_1562 [Maricaulis maris]